MGKPENQTKRSRSFYNRACCVSINELVARDIKLTKLARFYKVHKYSKRFEILEKFGREKKTADYFVIQQNELHEHMPMLAYLAAK